MVVCELASQDTVALDGFAGVQDADVVPELERLPDGLDIWVLNGDRAPLRVSGRGLYQAGAEGAAG